MTLISEAQQLLREGRTEEAERLFERVLGESPDNIEALNVVGLSALRAGRLARARELLEKAAAVDPRHALTQHHLGTAYASAGDYAAAISAHSNALKLEPE